MRSEGYARSPPSPPLHALPKNSLFPALPTILRHPTAPYPSSPSGPLAVACFSQRPPSRAPELHVHLITKHLAGLRAAALCRLAHWTVACWPPWLSWHTGPLPDGGNGLPAPSLRSAP